MVCVSIWHNVYSANAAVICSILIFLHFIKLFRTHLAKGSLLQYYFADWYITVVLIII